VKLRVGQTLHSTVDDVTVVVIRAPEDDLAVTYGGADMTEGKPEAAGEGAPAGEGVLLGKRYADEGVGIELLCTKPGQGTLAVNGTPLPLKEAKPLPASD
jgi:hypothetical protein